MAMVLLAIIQGFVQIGYQLVASKFVTSVYGSNLLTWSMIVTIFLISMAAGQYCGATIARTQSTSAMRRLLTIAFAAAAGWILLTFFALSPLQELSLGIFNHVLPNLAFLIASIFAIPIVLTSILIPMALKLEIERVNGSDAGFAGFQLGKMASMNSAGSVAGALFVALVAFGPLGFGSAGSISLFAALLLFSCLYIQLWSKQGHITLKSKLLLFLAFFALVIPGSYSLREMNKFTLPQWIGFRPDLKIVNVSESSYTKAFVTDRVDESGFTVRSMIFAGQRGVQCQIRFRSGSNATPESLMLHFEHSLLRWGNDPVPKKILILGLGGGCFSHFIREALTPSSAQTPPSLTYVEIDETVARSARQFFFLPNEDVVHISDARGFLHKSRETYDLIVVDTFAEGRNIAEHLLSLEYFELLRLSLAPGGGIFINTASYVPLEAIQAGKSASLNGLLNTISNAFPGFRIRTFQLKGTTPFSLLMFLSETAPDPGKLARRVKQDRSDALLNYASATEFQVPPSFRSAVVFRDHDRGPGWDFALDFFRTQEL